MTHTNTTHYVTVHYVFEDRAEPPNQDDSRDIYFWVLLCDPYRLGMLSITAGELVTCMACIACHQREQSEQTTGYINESEGIL